MVGAVGVEPTIAISETAALTAWLRPNKQTSIEQFDLVEMGKTTNTIKRVLHQIVSLLSVLLANGQVF